MAGTGVGVTRPLQAASATIIPITPIHRITELISSLPNAAQRLKSSLPNLPIPQSLNLQSLNLQSPNPLRTPIFQSSFLFFYSSPVCSRKNIIGLLRRMETDAAMPTSVTSSMVMTTMSRLGPQKGR